MKKRLQLLDRHKAAMRNRKRKIFASWYGFREMVGEGHHVFTVFDDVGRVPAHVWDADIAEFRVSEARGFLSAVAFATANVLGRL